MTTYFDTLTTSFADVPLEPGVDTAKFIDASKGLVRMFDLLGSAAFVVVQKDLNGNIAKLEARLAADPEKSATLEGLLAAEAAEGNRTASQGLMWLLRGLEFTLIGLQRSLENPTEELSISFNKAYEDTLKKFHSWVVRPVFTLAMKSCPYRKDFYEKLGSPQERVLSEGKKWLDSLEVIVAKMKVVYTEKNYYNGL